jgi:hypothetical protein
MAKRISTLALMLFVAGAPVLTVGQTKSAQYATDAHASDTKPTSANKDSHGESRPADCIDGKKKAEKKIKQDAKPAPSKEEQEFEKTLLGIFG